MKSIRILAFLLCFFGLGAAAQAQTQTCYSAQAPLVVSYANNGGSGTISIAYQVCYDAANPSSSLLWSGTVTYNNVNWGNGFTVNGTMAIELNYSSTGISSISFNGGPLNYTVGGQPYVVSFNNLAFTFGQGFQVTGATGTISINGQTVNGSPGHWGYLFH